MNALDHVDVVVTHSCNMNCPHCIDKYRGCNDKVVPMGAVKKFLQIVKNHSDSSIEVLLLGGEPTVIGSKSLIEIAKTVRNYGFEIVMSTNGKLRDVIIDCIPYFNSIQVTTHSDKETDFWSTYGKNINIKLAGDKNMTMKSLKHFMDYTDGRFFRRSVSMYFTPDFEELCVDEDVWNLLNSLEWNRNGSYMYSFYNGVRFKKCIHGETNIIDEPTVPKLYPSGVYNKTWCNEHEDCYLG